MKYVKVFLAKDCYYLYIVSEHSKYGYAKPWTAQTKLGWTLSETLHQQEISKPSTKNLVAAKVDPLTDQVKTWWSTELYASDCREVAEKYGEFNRLIRCRKQLAGSQTIVLLLEKSFENGPHNTGRIGGKFLCNVNLWKMKQYW